MHGSEDEVSGFGGSHTGGHGIGVSHFADKDDVGVLSHEVSEGLLKVAYVDSDFPLGDDGLAVLEEILDGVFDSNYVAGACAVYIVNHRSDGSSFSAAGGSYNKYEALRAFRYILEDIWEVERIKRGDIGTDASCSEADGTSLTKYVYSEAVLVTDFVSEVEGAVYGEEIFLLW